MNLYKMKGVDTRYCMIHDDRILVEMTPDKTMQIKSDVEKDVESMQSRGLAVTLDMLKRAEEEKKRAESGQEEGILVAMGNTAFCDSQKFGETWRPKIGDTISFKRYAGNEIGRKPGVDVWYRLMRDADFLMALYKEKPTEVENE